MAMMRITSLMAADVGATLVVALLPARGGANRATTKVAPAGNFCGRRLSAPSASERLIQRLQLDEGGAVVAAGPEGDRGGRVVDEHGAHVGLMRQLIFDALARVRIEPHGAIRMHAAGPDLAVLVDGRAVRIGEGRQL